MADFAVLGIFEDAAQRDFHPGLMPNIAARNGLDLMVESRLTHGCRFDNLVEYMGLANHFHGVVVAVDGKKEGVAGKAEALRGGLNDRGVIPDAGVCWAIAIPSVEEWIMADALALPSAVAEERELDAPPTAARPGATKAERTAKQRLAEWTEALADAPPLRGGLEYAELVGRLVDPARVGKSRNRDFWDYLHSALPSFFESLRSAAG